METFFLKCGFNGLTVHELNLKHSTTISLLLQKKKAKKIKNKKKINDLTLKKKDASETKHKLNTLTALGTFSAQTREQRVLQKHKLLSEWNQNSTQIHEEHSVIIMEHRRTHSNLVNTNCNT